MALVWNEIKPIDGFRVSIKSLLSHSQHRTLTHLYQPLIGSLSYALYLTLSNEVEGERLFSVEKNHQWLMSLMDDSLSAIYHARLRLEALGLLKTYILQKDEHQTVFEYELIHPFSPEQFFADDLLSICLYNQVGAHRYRELRMRYSAYYMANGGEKSEKKEVTKEFHQVFSSLSPTELVALQGSEMNEQFAAWEKDYPLRKDQSGPATLKFDQYELDIEALKASLIRGLDASSIINQQTLPSLKKIAYFYQLDEWSLGRIIQDSLNQEDELDIDLLREQAKEWYRFQEGGRPPTIRAKTELQERKELPKLDALTEEEQHLLQLEQISPLQLLEEFQRGGKVAEPDVKLVEELLFEYKLEPAVINLLLEYIFYTNNYKLPRNLVTKVAAHWKRFNVQTIQEAQALALKEQKQYKEWQSKQEEKELESKRAGAPRYPSAAAKSVRRDKLPPWIEAQQQSEQQEAASPGVKAEQTEESSISEERRQRIQQRLKNLEKLKKEGRGVK